MPLMRTTKEGMKALLFAATAAVGCRGFAPVRRRPAPAARTNTALAYSVDSYFDSFNDHYDGEEPKKGVGGVSRYLDSLSGGSEVQGAGAIDDSIDDEAVGGGGGMFDVQNNYFGSLGAKNDHDAGARGELPPSDATAPLPDNDEVDLWDAAALLNFEIGQPPEDAQTGTDPWERAAAVQHSYYRDEDREGTPMTYEEMVAHHEARLCPKLLLTQRALQSFIHLCEECRDPHSGKWLEDFLDAPNLGNYHGTGAFDVTKYPTWDAVLYDIMDQPNEKMIVSAKRRGRGHGGWSKNNPYLRERWVEFNIDVRPASLVQRLLPVREQLAGEFETFLDVVRMVDERILTSIQTFLEEDTWTDTAAFDRISNEALANYTHFRSGSQSPLFRGNFDLLYSLCTQASAHRLLRDLRSRAKDDVTTQWYEQFYADNVTSHFDGDQPFGRADDFLDALLSAEPSLVVSPWGEPLGWTDPVWIAQRLVAARSEVAREWKGAMNEVKDDHAKLNTDLFRVMMGRTIRESGNDVLQIEEGITFDDISDSVGAFE